LERRGRAKRGEEYISVGLNEYVVMCSANIGVPSPRMSTYKLKFEEKKEKNKEKKQDNKKIELNKKNKRDKIHPKF
jgi:hypothetical protein